MIANSIKNIRYILVHPSSFDQTLIPLTVCWMKLFIEVTIEMSMILVTAYENMNSYMIMNYSALTIISMTDTYYTQLLKDDLKLKMTDAENKLPIINKKMDWSNMKWYEKANHYVLCVLMWVYETMYFHFWPYLAIYYSFYVIRDYVGAKQ